MNNTYDPRAVVNSDHRAAIYQTLLRDRPIHFNEALNAWIVTNYDAIREVLLDTERFSAAGSIGISDTSSTSPEVRAILDTGYPRFPGIIEMDPPVHKIYRNLVSAAFTPKRVASFESNFRQMAGELIDGFIDLGRGDLISLFAFPYPMRVICFFLGIPEQDIPEIDRMSDGFRELEAGTILNRPVEEQKAIAQNFVDFQRYAAELVQERRRSPKDDLISLMLQETLPSGRSVNTEEAISMVIHLLFAGHETNARLLGTLLYTLLATEDLWARLVHDVSLAPEVIEEGLRLEPPVVYHSRRALTDVELQGVTIPAGGEVHLVFAAGNRDPQHFEDPDEFRPARSNVRQHLGFGLGIHFCIGAPVARLESRVALETLLGRLPQLRLEDSYVPRYEDHAMLRGLETLMVKWD